MRICDDGGRESRGVRYVFVYFALLNVYFDYIVDICSFT